MIPLISLISGMLTAFFGWCGGRGDDYWEKHQEWPRWLLQSWVRDYLIPLVCAITAWIFGVHSWWLLLMYVATLGALSTYWDRLFGYDNFFFHGLVIGLASFPIAIVTGQWWMFAIRSLVLCLWMGIWSGITKDAGLEEAGRYSMIGLTVWMIC